VAGGHAAGSGRCIVNPDQPDARILKPLSDGNIVKRGDILRVETGGGGGWGHPFDREAERVAADVRDGFVSRASAEAHYGVVLDNAGKAVDGAATAERRRRRPPAKLFHRHGYHDVLA
jgi:N-methylhydantoinase B